MTEVRNAKDFPEVFYCRHMLPGIAGYEVLDKATGKTNSDNLYIDVDAMKRAAPSFVGKPVYVQHQKVDLENIHEADGFVIDCFYNELDGWEWAKFIAVSDEAKEAIRRKWSVSNAYLPKTWEGKGQHLSLDYDRKIGDYVFTHLAIVPNPRYEQALIYTPEEFKSYQEEKKRQLEELRNSKPEPKEPAMKFFRNNKEEVKAGDILDTDFVEIKNDDGATEIVTVAQLKAAKLEEKKNAASKKNEKMVDDDEEVEVDGEKVNMADLKACYKNSKKMKKNADEESEAKKAKEMEETKNAEEEKKKKEEEKTNAAEAKKKFDEITNAHKSKVSSGPVKIVTQMDGLKRGKDRYTFDAPAK